MKNRSCCVFDLYGTLVDIRTDEGTPELWQRMARYYALHGAAYEPQALRARFFALVSQMEKSAPLRQDAHEAHPEIEIERVFARLFEDAGVACGERLARESALRFRRLSTEYIRLYPGAKELIDSLRAAGRRVYLLSNAQAVFTLEEMAHLGMEGWFDGVVLSSREGVRKPDKRLFDVLFARFGIEAKDCVMIGNDGVCDIAGAKAAGMRTIYIRSNISPAEPLPQADAVLEEMDLARVGRILLGD